MNLLLNCFPNLLPFQNPEPDKPLQLKLMLERVDSFATVQKAPFPTEYERRHARLYWLLKSSNWDLESSYKKWLEWVEWRHSLKIDEITEEEIKCETILGTAKWAGKDIYGRPCCVMTARHNIAEMRSGNYQTYRKFMIRVVEEGIDIADDILWENRDIFLNPPVVVPPQKPVVVGLGAPVAVMNRDMVPVDSISEGTERQISEIAAKVGDSDENGFETPNDNATSSSVDLPTSVSTEETAIAKEMAFKRACNNAIGEVCILYDRRGIEDYHINGALYRLTRHTFEDLKYYYGNRLGVIYILHVNWFFQLLYQYVLKPFLDYAGKTVVQVVNTPDELLAYFKEEQLAHLYPYTEPENNQAVNVSTVQDSSSSEMIPTLSDASASRSQKSVLETNGFAVQGDDPSVPVKEVGMQDIEAKFSQRMEMIREMSSE